MTASLAAFERALLFVLAVEGGASNHVADPGGLTMNGVTQATYDRYRERASLVRRPVTSIEDVEVREIYRDFWNESHAAELAWPMSLLQLDAAINHGPRGAIRILQRTLGVREDGIFGPVTRAAAQARTTVDASFVNDALWTRLRTYAEKEHFNAFGRGWVRRLQKLREEAVA